MKPLPDLSRRDFLKLSASGLLAAAIAELKLDRAFAAPVTLGRMTLSGIALFDSPSFKARQLHLFGRDEVVNVTGEVDGDEGNPANKTWYQLEGGYSYSGWIQPVNTNYNLPVFDIPKAGQVGEITVPISDSKIAPSTFSRHGPRYYYSSTHWVTETIVVPDEKGIWYKVYDSHLQKSFYVASYDMRLIPDEELTLLSPDVPDVQKSIIVDTATQLVTAYEGDKMVFSTHCSTGAGGTKTPLGDFKTYHKGPSIHMTNDGDDTAHVYDLPGVPWVSFFTGTGISLHGTYWHNDYGRPRSHGCVNLPPDAAKFIYRWTTPVVPPDTDYLYLPGQGTKVQVMSSNS